MMEDGAFYLVTIVSYNDKAFYFRGKFALRQTFFLSKAGEIMGNDELNRCHDDNRIDIFFPSLIIKQKEGERWRGFLRTEP